MKRIFTTGTFDLLHYGHINLLKQAKSLGDYLIVGLNRNPEGKTPINSAEERKAVLESIKYVDKVVILDSQQDKFNYLETHNIDVFAIGSDYKGYVDIADIEAYCKVVFIDRTENISTSIIKNRLINSYEFKTFIIDIDDTICTTIDRDFEHSIPHLDVIEKINSLHDNGWKIILSTSRGAKSCNSLEARIAKYEMITRTWLDSHGVKYDELIFGKENADFYVDDKAMSIEEFLRF